jgi:hypothetical protein
MLFGVRSGPNIYSNTTEPINQSFQVVMDCPRLKNMQDDFFCVDRGPNSVTNALYLASLKQWLKCFGIEWSPEKTEGPTTKIVVLGLEIDTVASTISVPPARMQTLRALLPQWLNQKEISKKELQRVIGALSFCCYGVRWGRAFLRRLINAMAALPLATSTMELSPEIQEDLQWWIRFSQDFNGQSLIPDPNVSELRKLGCVCHADASGNCCAGVWNDKWYNYHFTEDDKHKLPAIAHRELYAVICLAKTFEEAMKGKTILIYCDNMSTVIDLKKGRSKDKVMNSLIRELFYICAMASIQVVAKHLPTTENELADCLSRDERRHQAWKLRPSLERFRTLPSLPTLTW